MNQEELNSRIASLKALRMAAQLAISAVELDDEDAAELSALADEWAPGGKFKKGMLVQDGGVLYRCVANVNKSDTPPSEDAVHWAEVSVSQGDGIEVWSAGASYQKGARVHYPDADGPVYVSQKNNNDVEPGTDEKYWALEEAE